MQSRGEGLRKNQGKNRLDLLSPIAQYGVGEVMTMGAEKYADRNWEKGMPWSKVIASLKRHLNAIERGEDYDEESGLLHADHVATNAQFLSHFYRTFPEGDDRPHKYLNKPRIGLDIDEVLADFVGAMMKRFPEMKDRAVFWNDPYIIDHFSEVVDDTDFWANIEPLIEPKELGFEPVAYITSRAGHLKETTEQWLKKHGFPKAPLYVIGKSKENSNENQASKVGACKIAGVDWFVDDRYDAFCELNSAGICTFLMSRPHNERYDVGFKRIKSLKELI